MSFHQTIERARRRLGVEALPNAIVYPEPATTATLARSLALCGRKPERIIVPKVVSSHTRWLNSGYVLCEKEQPVGKHGLSAEGLLLAPLSGLVYRYAAFDVDNHDERDAGNLSVNAWGEPGFYLANDALKLNCDFVDEIRPVPDSLQLEADISDYAGGLKYEDLLAGLIVRMQPELSTTTG